MKSFLLCRFRIVINFKIIPALLLLFFIQFARAQQTGSIRGTVKTSDGKPGEFVTIGLNGTNKGTVVNQKGTYRIGNITPGSYTITAKFIGLIAQSRNIEVRPGETLTVDFTLNENSEQLQEVVVSGNKARFTRESSTTVAKMPLKNLENPQVYTSLTKELIQDQQIVTYSDILKNVPGVNLQLQTNTNSPGGTVGVRGFSGGSYLRNGLPGMTVGFLDPVNIETLEAIKGPSGALFGSSLTSFGGLFNRVTKKPFDAFQATAAYSGGSYGLSRTTLDVNAPLNEDKTLLFRVNGAKHYEGSFQDAGYQSYTFIAPSLTYKVSDKMTIYLDGEYLNGNFNSFYRLFADGSNATGVHSPQDLKLDFKRRFVGDDMKYLVNTGNFYAQVDYAMGAGWKSQSNFSYSGTSSSGPTAYLSMLAGNERLTRTTSLTDYSRNAMTNIQQNFTGDIKIGGLRNRVLIGLDYLHNETKASSSSLIYDTLNVEDPGIAYTRMTAEAVTARFAGAAFNKTSVQQNTYSAYVQDVINITGQLVALASVRVDRFQNLGTFNLTTRVTGGKYSQTAFSPKFGLVYEVIKDKVSVFGNYMNGFQNVAPVTQPDASVSTFKPQQANQLEGGVKLNLMDGKLTGNISYYDIKVTNTVRTDPDRPGFSIQNGNQLSKGFEADMAFSPIQGLNMVAGYSHNNSKLVKSAANVDGLRPVSAGPADMVNGWISYRINHGELHGLGLGFGGNYASDNLVILTTVSSFALPAYTTLNASVFYDQPKYRIGLKCNDLNNEKYYIGWGTTIPQTPRSFIAEFVLKFGGVK